MAITRVLPDLVTPTADYTFNSATTTNSLTVGGTTNLQQSVEKLQTKTSATGVVTHDFSLGSIFYHSSISANFTSNFTNLPTTNDRAMVATLILIQGGTAYLPTAVQIGGVAQTINWLNTASPTGNANKKDVVTFTFVRTGSAWTTFGLLASYG